MSLGKGFPNWSVTSPSQGSPDSAPLRQQHNPKDRPAAGIKGMLSLPVAAPASRVVVVQGTPLSCLWALRRVKKAIATHFLFQSQNRKWVMIAFFTLLKAWGAPGRVQQGSPHPQRSLQWLVHLNPPFVPNSGAILGVTLLPLPSPGTTYPWFPNSWGDLVLK